MGDLRRNLKALAIRTKEKIKEHAGAIAFWTTTAFITKGCIDGICARREIRNHNKWTDDVELPTFNHNVNVARADQERINDLEEKVNKLMEEAMRDTEGKKEESE